MRLFLRKLSLFYTFCLCLNKVTFSRIKWWLTPIFLGAPDVWDSARFTSIFLASGFSCSQALSTPAHTQVTQTVRQPKCKNKVVFESQVLVYRWVQKSKFIFEFSQIFLVALWAGFSFSFTSVLVFKGLLFYMYFIHRLGVSTTPAHPATNAACAARF